MQFIACWSLPTPFSTALPSTGNEASAPMCSLTSSMWCLRTSKAVCSSTPHGVSSVSAAHIPPPSLRTWSTCWTPCRPTPSQGVPWFQERGLWQDNSYEPRPGDIIFFDWDDGGQDGSSDHVGIVEKAENGHIYCLIFHSMFIFSFLYIVISSLKVNVLIMNLVR